MILIGLTGSIASGKSTIARLLKDANIPVIDADELAQRVTSENNQALLEVSKVFGQEIIINGRTLDRKRLGQIVFNEPEKLRTLEAILHPLIHDLFLKEIDLQKKKGAQHIVYVVPLLFEKGLERIVDNTILVICDEELMIERIIKRDKITRNEAKKRIALQMSNDEKIKHADEIIINNGTLDELKQQIHFAWYRLTGLKQLPLE